MAVLHFQYLEVAVAPHFAVLSIGVRRGGQKVLLSIRNMGGESTAAWRQFLDDLDTRGLKVSLRGGPSYWAKAFRLGPTLCPTIDTDPK